MNTIHTKLMEVQASLKAPKSQYSDFGGYKYRKCEDILEAVKPILKAQGLTLTCSDTLENIGGRYYIKATATLTDTETGEHTSTTAYAREEETKKGMDGSQITGASSSYARKYALNGLFAIDDTQDSDTTNRGDGQPRKITRAAAKKEAVTYAGGLTETQYRSLVQAAAKGEKVKSGENARDAFIKHCKPTPQQIEDFDAAIADYEMKLR